MTSFAAYMAFFSADIQELNENGLVCRRPKGNDYVCSDDRFVLEFYYEHKDDDAKTLTHAVMTDERMWGQDLTKVPGFEEAAAEALELIRKEGALKAFAACL